MLHGAVAPSLPAFAVTHTLTGHFAKELRSENVTITGNTAINNDKQIVVIRHNHVTLYAICISKTKSSKPHESNEQQVIQESSVKFHSANSLESKNSRNSINKTNMLENGEVMKFIMECDLHAPPLDACVCRPSNVNIDLIMLLFDDFHISLIQYNPLCRQFDTVALIQLDDRGCALQRCALPPLLRIDSTKAHVAVLVKRTELFYFTVLQRIDKRDAAATISVSNTSDNAKTEHAMSDKATINSQNILNDKVNNQTVQESQRKETNSSRNNVFASKEKPTKISFDAWGDDDDDDEDSKSNESDSHKDEENKTDRENKQNSENRENESLAAGANADQKQEDDEKHLSDNNASKFSSKDFTEECHDVVLISEITHVHLRSVNNALRNVRDVCFVESSTEPLLAVLYEKDPTWAGRVKLIEWRSRTVESNMLTCSVMWLRVSNTFYSSFGNKDDHVIHDNNININYANRFSNVTNNSNKEMKLLLSIGEVDYLPYDTTHMMALPARENILASSVLCFSPSIIVHVNTTSGFGVYINANGKEAVANVRQSANIMYTAVQWSELAQARSLRVVKTNLNFANCASQLINHYGTNELVNDDDYDDYRMVDKSSKNINKRSSMRSLQTQRLQEMELLTFTEDQGTVVLLTLHVVNHAIQSISVRIVMTECFCTSAAWLDQNVYFLGSANGDSRVIEYLPLTHETKNKPMLEVIQTFTGLCPVMDAAVIESTSAIELSKRLNHARTSKSTNHDNKISVAENEFLDTSIAQSPFASLYHEIILDPLRSATLEHLSEGSGQMDVLLCSGVHGAGSLSVLRQSIRDYIVRREQINAVSLFYIECKTHSSHTSNKSLKRPRDNTATSLEMPNEFHSEQQTSENTNSNSAMVNVNRTHLVMTGMDFTLLFTIRGDSVQQVLGTSMDIHSRTIFASYLHSVNAIVQVTETELRLISVDGKELLHHVQLISLIHGAPITMYDTVADEYSSNANEILDKVNDVSTDEKVQSAFLLSSLSCVIILFANGTLCKCKLTHGGNNNINGNDDDDDDDSSHESNESTPSAHLTVLMNDIIACSAWNEKEQVDSSSNSLIVVVTRAMHLTVLHVDIDTLESIIHFPHFAIMPQVAIADVPVKLHRMPTRLSAEPLPTITHIHVVQHHDTLHNNTEEEEECSEIVQKQCTNSNTLNKHKERKLSQNVLQPCSLVCILSSGEMITYKFIPQDKYGPARLLKYLYHFLDIKPERDVMETIEAKRKRLVNERAHLEEETMKLRHCSNRMVPFDSIAGHRGVYVCGRHPVFLFWHPSRQELVLCRHNVHNLVRGFAPFTSRHLRSGYVYCCEGVAFFAMSENDVMRSRDKMSINNSVGNSFHSNNNNGMELMSNGWWLMKRIWLGAATPHQSIYHGPSHCCFVITSNVVSFSPRRAPFDVQLHIKYDEEGNVSTSVEEPIALPPLQASVTHAPVPLNDRYTVHLYSCTSWKLHDSLELEVNEKVLCACEVEITRDDAYDAETIIRNNNVNSTSSSSWASTRAPVCAIGTAFPLGEDITTRGRLLLLTTHFNNSENVKDVTEADVKIKMLVSEPMKGPVTALCGIQGDMALAIGCTLRVLHYDEIARKLETNALLYANIYVTALSSIKDYLLYGDLHYSAALCRYSAVNHTLTPLAKDVHSMSVVSCTSLYHQHALGLLFSDDQRNLSMLGYKPRVRSVDNSLSLISSTELTNTNTTNNTAGALFSGVTTSNSNFMNDNQADKSSGGGFSSNGVSAKTVKERKVLESLLTMDGEYRMASGSVTKMLRFRLHEIPSSVILYITNTGEVGFVIALGEQTNQTAQWVSRRLQSEMCHLAGLPPKMFLGFSQDDPQRAFRGKEQLIHTPLLRQFFCLDLQMRKLLASAALTQLERVLNVGATIEAESRVV